MSANFGDTKFLYDLTFKIVSIQLNDDGNKSDQSDICVIARFAEKCVQISHVGMNDDKSGDEKPQKEKSTVDTARKSSQSASTKSSLGSSKKPSQVPSDAAKKLIPVECDSSDDITKSKRESTKPRQSEKAEASKSRASEKPRESTKPILFEKVGKQSANDADDEATEVDLTKFRKSAKDSDPKISRQKRSSSSKQEKSSDDCFGSCTERFESTPFCLYEKLAKHCIKYEIVTRDGQLIGEFNERILKSRIEIHEIFSFSATTNQQLSDCFAQGIRSKEFLSDNICMQLLLLKPRGASCGFMNVCILIQKADREHDDSD